MNNNKLVSRIRTTLRMSLLPVALTLLAGCSSGGDSTPPPSINIANASVVEGNSGMVSLEFTVTASRAVGSGASVQYSTSNGTATAGSDYTAVTNGTLTFAPNSTSATLTIIVNGDTLLETDETLTVTLSSPTNLTLGTTTVATGTVTNDDATTFNGYFSGSATVNTSVNITDLIGLAYVNRLMLFSRTGASNVLYDITAITNTTGNDYTGTVAMYSGAAGAQSKTTTTANMTISGSTITGTLNAASGLGKGTFSITFDPADNVGATLARTEGNMFNIWYGNLYGYDIDTNRFSADQTNGSYYSIDDTTHHCQYTGTLVIPDSQLSIYQLSHDIVDSVYNTCTVAAVPYFSTGHTGFASVITTTTTDDTLVYAFSNGTIALFAVVSH